MASSRTSVRPVHRTSVRSMPAVRPDGTEDLKKSGTCPVCGGNVVEKVDIKEGDRRHYMRPDGLHCTKCGIKFEFMPPEGVASRR